MTIHKTDGERLLQLEANQTHILEKVDSLADNMNTFMDNMRAARREDHFTKKDVIQMAFGILAASGVIFAGFNYLVDSRVAPVVNAQAAQLVQFNNRFDTFQDGIRSLRELAAAEEKAGEASNVQLAADRKTLDTLEGLHLEGLNATQDAKLLELDRRMTAYDHLPATGYGR